MKRVTKVRGLYKNFNATIINLGFNKHRLVIILLFFRKVYAKMSICKKYKMQFMSIVYRTKNYTTTFYSKKILFYGVNYLTPAFSLASDLCIEGHLQRSNIMSTYFFVGIPNDQTLKMCLQMNFLKLDKTKRHYVKYKTFSILFRELKKYRKSRKCLKTMAKHCDVNKDKKVTEDEFIGCFITSTSSGILISSLFYKKGFCQFLLPEYKFLGRVSLKLRAAIFKSF